MNVIPEESRVLHFIHRFQLHILCTFGGSSPLKFWCVQQQKMCHSLTIFPPRTRFIFIIIVVKFISVSNGELSLSMGLCAWPASQPVCAAFYLYRKTSICDCTQHSHIKFVHTFAFTYRHCSYVYKVCRFIYIVFVYMLSIGGFVFIVNYFV